MTYCQRHPLTYTIIIVCKMHFTKDMFLNYEQIRLQPHAIPNSILTRNNKEESIRTQNMNIVEIKPKEATITEVDIIDLLEEDTTLQNETNKALDTETPMSISSSSIGTQTVIALSSTGTQTSLSLSANSPRKIHLYQNI